MFTPEKLKELEVELLPYKSLMGAASDAVLDQEVSNYPIFVIFQDEINVGIPLDTAQVYGRWQVNISSLEEFATKQLIEANKIDEFRNVYKDPKSNLCLFVISQSNATFIFIPR